MYAGCLSFNISKSFGTLQLVPEPGGLRMCYIPVVDGVEDVNALGYLDLLLPLEGVGGLWATARAFLYAVESLDENVILQGDEAKSQSDTLIKLYRDKPRGQQGRLSGEETCWLRLVTGRAEEERRRIKLGPRDLLSLELACNAVMTLSAAGGTHKPYIFRPNQS